MNQEIPPQFNPLGAPEFPMKQLKRLHGELTRLEVFIQMTSLPEDVPENRKKIEKIYEVQEIIEEYVIEENERVKKAKSK